METIYHITGADDWAAALREGYLEAPSLKIEGFIHCSHERQVAGVIERYFSGRTDLIKLAIDPALLEAPLRYELARSVGEAFPHVYGRINLTAVREAVRMEI